MRLFWTAVLCGVLVCLHLGCTSRDSVTTETEGFPVEPVFHNAVLQNWHLLIDPSGQLSLKEVQLEQTLFKRLDTPSYAAMGSDKAIWLHVHLPAYEAPHWLWLSARHIELLDVYLLQEGRLVQHIQGGERRPPLKTAARVTPYLFALPDDGRAREAYVRLQSNHPMMAYFQLVDEQGLVGLEQTAYFRGFLVGLLGMLVLYNVLQAFWYRQPTYVWLSVFYFSLMGCFIANAGMLAAWLPVFAYRQSLLADLMPLFSSMALVAFSLNVLQPRVFPEAARWLLRSTFYLVALEALVMPMTQWPWHGLLAHLVSVLAVLVSWAIVLCYGVMNSRSDVLLGLGLFLLSLYTLGLSALPLGYQMLDSERAISGLFGLATLGGFLLNLGLSRRNCLRVNPRVPICGVDKPRVARPPSSGFPPLREVLGSQVLAEWPAFLGALLHHGALLAETPLSAKQRDRVWAIRAATQALLHRWRALDDSLYWTNIPLGLEQQPVYLADLIRSVLDVLQSQAAAKGVCLVYEEAADFPRPILGDFVLLQQLMQELFEALIVPQPSGSSLYIESFLLKEELSWVGLRIRGQGLPLDSITAVQQMSRYSASPAQWRQWMASQGSWVMVVVQALWAMDGRLCVRSISPSDYELELCWPLLGAPPAAGGGDASEAALVGARVLVVASDGLVRTALTQCCQGWGIEVDAVCDGREALALLRTRAYLHDLFDAVLISQDCGGTDALSLATRIKGDPVFYQDTSLILLADSIPPKVQVAARNAGVNAWLRQPISSAALKNSLMVEFGRRPHWRNLLQIERLQPIQIPSSFRVLLAEDDRTSIQVISNALAKTGIEPDIVGNGQEALSAMQNRHYDLVLMDCEMPVLTGYEATRLLRCWEQQTSQPHTVVVALTAHVLLADQEHAQAAGMDGYLAKPVELSQLRELIRDRVRANNRLAACVGHVAGSDEADAPPSG